jgi:hypothetical protein
MRVRIAYTIDVSDEYRAALAHQRDNHGGMVSRQEVKVHYERVGSSNEQDVMWEWEQCDEGCQRDR